MNRRPHDRQDRRRRIAEPSSASRLSTTRLSGCRQNGHRTRYASFVRSGADHPARRDDEPGAGPRPSTGQAVLWTAARTSVESLCINLWMTYALVSTRCCVQPSAQPQ
ncbi:hypothetical protein FRAAL5701 [Frankia alni ACN14a]|uniref:Uncharacterized protein n=1 Tax=Frankia alni (strain DSM 45986 / CECT 9034 / ACN14a) TaxID=326424 RepID=Q0RDY3_FRAAA|nr:hypothetical protein FRAAL5701 [Frankia alni ACN14a]